LTDLEQLLAPARLVVFVLVLARVVGLALIAPVLGSRMVLPRLRLALVVFLAIAMVPATAKAAAAHTAQLASSPVALIVALVIETAIGLLLGAIAQFVFGAVQLAGELAGMQMGFGMASLFDPQTHDRSVVLAQWQSTLALLLFLTVDGHHMLVQAVAESFRRVPPGAVGLGTASLGMTVTFASGIFVLALKIAAPVLILVLLTNAGLGALGKLVPQLNVMVVGFPVNVAAGFFILIAAMPFTMRLLEGAFADLSHRLAAVIDVLV
jgi:flagellar biosynthetic protein FliR